jgi:hypothetical protein
MPATFTDTAPGEAPSGTIATICVSLQLVVAAAGIVLNATTLLLGDGPNPVPLIVTEEPSSPVDGEMLETETDSISVN